jgi:hypothetical protein
MQGAIITATISIVIVNGTCSLADEKQESNYNYNPHTTVLPLVNYFVKPNEQKTSLLGLCRGEK